MPNVATPAFSWSNPQMTRRILLGLALFSLSAPVIAAERPPNILYILADDWGWGDLGCYGNPRIKTPNLDAFARQGTLLTQYYQCGSVCSPSRTAQFTGRYPARFGVHGHFATNEQNQNRGDAQLAGSRDRDPGQVAQGPRLHHGPLRQMASRRPWRAPTAGQLRVRRRQDRSGGAGHRLELRQGRLSSQVHRVDRR